MKITASILIMYFGLLMGQPFANMGLKAANKPANCRSNDMCCKEKAKHQDEAPGKEHSGGSCNRDFCNPFVPCGTSMPATKPMHSFKAVIRELTNNLNPATNDDIVSNYLPDCWRPPELLS